MQVAHDPRCAKSGVYWSWNGGRARGAARPRSEQGGQITRRRRRGRRLGLDLRERPERQSAQPGHGVRPVQVLDHRHGAEWPPANQPKSPCPTPKSHRRHHGLPEQEGGAEADEAGAGHGRRKALSLPLLRPRPWMLVVASCSCRCACYRECCWASCGEATSGKFPGDEGEAKRRVADVLAAVEPGGG